MTTTEMPLEDTDVEVAATPDPPRKRSNLIPALILAAALLGAAYMISSRGGGEAEAEAAHEVEEEIVPGEVVQLESMTLNLTDGRYLRLGLAVELVEGVPGGEWTEHGSPSRFMDRVIDRVGDWSGEQIAAPGGRDELKELLRENATDLFGEEFSEIYVTELIVQ